MTTHPRSRGDRIGPLVVGLAVAAVYAAGACPTIYVGDSGELVTAVHVLGIPHPTGYPLYVLLGKVWTLAVPTGSVAWRMSLFSAAAGGAGAAVLYATLRRLGAPGVAALVGTGLAAFGPSTWAEATVQRVYTLNACFVACATWCVVRWLEERRGAWLVWLAFVCGLGATNHTFMAIYGLVAGAVVLLIEPGIVRRWRVIVAAAAAGLVGMLPYLYLPIRSRMNPPLDWGNPETVRGVIDVILRAEFWERAWLERPSDFGPILRDWAASFPQELGWGGVGLAVLGFVALARRGRLWLLPLAVMLANVVVLGLHGSRSDIFIWHRYYMPSYWMAALLAGLGAGVVVGALPRVMRPVPLLLVGTLVATGWARFDRSDYRIADAFSRAVLDAVPPGGTLIATDDNVLFVLLYLRWVEGLRPDVHLVLQGIGDADLPPLRFDPSRDAVMFTHNPNWRLPELRVDPVGVVFRAARAGSPPSPIEASPTVLPGEHDPAVPKDYLTQNLLGHFHFMLGLSAEAGDWPRAEREFLAAAAAAPDNDVLFYNLGLVYERVGLWDRAERAYERSHAINPRHIASNTRVRASDRLAVLRTERERVTAVERELEDDALLAATSRGSSAWHRRLAALLAGRDEMAAARGHELRAVTAPDG